MKGAHQNIVLRLGDNLAFVAGNADSVTHEVVGRTIDDVSGLE